MKKLFISAVFLFMMLTPLLAQNVLVLEKSGVKKSYKYFEGDRIEIKTVDSVTIKGTITSIKDTAIILNYYTEVKLSNIKQVSRTRWFVSILSKALLLGGSGLIVVEAINGALSNSGNINMNLLYYGAGAVAAGALLIPLDKAKFQIAPDKWRIKILQVEKEFNYQKNKPIKF